MGDSNGLIRTYTDKKETRIISYSEICLSDSLYRNLLSAAFYGPGGPNGPDGQKHASILSIGSIFGPPKALFLHIYAANLRYLQKCFKEKHYLQVPLPRTALLKIIRKHFRHS